MEGALERKESPLSYEPYTRSYSLEYGPFFKDEDTGEIVCVVASNLSYCPWCGVKFPKDLMDEWAEIVKDKFGVENTLDKKELAKVPKEYMTEEWWKKRGL